MRPRSRSILSSAILIAFGIPCALAAQQSKRKELVGKTTTPASTPADSGSLILPSGLKARAIGPAVMGGRVSSIALDPVDPWTFYAGLGTGGIMKSSDNGSTFECRTYFFHIKKYIPNH